MCPHRRSCSKIPFALLNRREWIKLFMLGGVTNLAFGRAPKRQEATSKAALVAPPPPAIQPVLADISQSNNSSCVVPLKLSYFPALQTVGGSLQIYFSNYINPMIVTRAESETFYAMDSSCTHSGFPVDPYNPNEGLMTCTNHGSQYDVEGRVVFGPATADLTRLKCAFDGGGTVQVEIEGVPLRVNSVRPVGSPLPSNTRLELKFPGTQGCRYRVRYYADAGAAPQAVSFATTAGGPADQTSILMPFGVTAIRTIYVDAPGARGFFAIEMALGPYLPL